MQKKPYALQFINNQIPENVNPDNPAHKPFYDLGWREGSMSHICLAAVQRDGEALQLVKYQTPEICIAAVKKNGYAFQYVKDLPSIALLIDQSTLDKIMSLETNNFTQKSIQNAQAIIKIREAHQIAERINETESSLVNPVNKKVKL